MRSLNEKLSCFCSRLVICCLELAEELALSEDGHGVLVLAILTLVLGAWLARAARATCAFLAAFEVATIVN